MLSLVVPYLSLLKFVAPSVSAGARYGDSDGDEGWSKIYIVVQWQALQTSHIKNVDVTVSGDGPLLDRGWDNWEQQFLQTAHPGLFYVVVNRSNATVIHAILRGKILAKVNETGRLRLGRVLEDEDRPDRWVMKDIILAIPHTIIIHDSLTALTAYQRFYLATCHGTREREDFLTELQRMGESFP